MLFTLEVSQSSLENAAQPLPVITERLNLKDVSDLFPINPFAKTTAPSSRMCMPERSRVHNEQHSARSSDDKDSNPFAVIK